MQINRGLTKNAMRCDSMCGQNSGGLHASRAELSVKVEPVPGPTPLRRLGT
jgi:hypothetical protein